MRKVGGLLDLALAALEHGLLFPLSDDFNG